MKLHYFNPGHETAVLNASKYYQPPRMVAKMQEDLALLPAWYAEQGDYVFIGAHIARHCERREVAVSKVPFARHCELLAAKQSSLFCFLDCFGLRPRNDVAKNLSPDLPVEFWGISPQAIHYFETFNEQYGLQLQIPEWKEEYRFLGSRFAAQKALASLMEAIPEIERDILPQFYSTVEEIENQMSLRGRSTKQSGENLPRHCEGEARSNPENKQDWIASLQAARNDVATFHPLFDKFIIKSPYSSSGRGLLWLSPGKLPQSERQIISGMLKKQSQVSLEKALDKRLDFSMHFEITKEKETHFIGYSVFQTNAKGVYESSLLADQETLVKQITALINKDLLQKVQETLTGILHEMYSPYFIGNIGVDMMAYFSNNQFRLHPCVEINMRKSMGYLAIRLFEKYMHPNSQGHFFVEFHKSPQTLNEKHLALQKQFPLQIEKDWICSGYLNLCPVGDRTNYLAYVLVTSLRDVLKACHGGLDPPSLAN